MPGTQQQPDVDERGNPSLANLRPPWKPGESGNPKGRPTAGASIREQLNILVASGLTEIEVRAIARDTSAPVAKRAAAERIARTLEAGDVADFEPWLRGKKTLAQLRADGVNTAVLRKARVGEKGSREIELHDRARPELYGIIENTEPSPGQTDKNERLDAGKTTENISWWQPPVIHRLPLPPHLSGKSLPPPRQEESQ